jgi:hypothetical protein
VWTLLTSRLKRRVHVGSRILMHLSMYLMYDGLVTVI